MLGLLLAATGYTIRKKNKGSDVLSSVPLIDGHNDLPYGLRLVANNQLSNFNFSANLTQDPVWGWLHTDLPRLRAGRVGAQMMSIVFRSVSRRLQFWAAYIACNSQYKDAVQQVIEQVDVIKRLVAKYPEDLQFATSAQGIWDAFKRGKIASLIGVESGHALDSRMAMLRTLYELGARYVTLTHSCNTPWADSSPADDASTGVPTEHNGLSEFGKNMEGVIVGGRRIKCIRFADDMALLAEETILRDMLLELNDSCEQYGMKINANKSKSMVIGRKVKTVNLRILNEAVEQVDNFKYLGCTISSNMSCSQEVKRRIAMAKEASNRKRRIFCGPLEKELRKILVKCFVWSVALYGAETWTLRQSEEKRIETFEMWIWRRMERVKWTDRIRNEAVLERAGEERMMLKLIRK
ncbi:hypothetical protein ANN_25411 [Periplaneta americana]|uniref:Dipeptidase n=1 Tax=Periplaneta americana TaxID=6978 RepID=A0ABQ8S1E8_PERAM|nr:hypothetical protein ANN_25411 [Periplaneta americana]